MNSDKPTETDFFEVKHALAEALRVINSDDDEVTELARLSAFKVAMASEIALAVMTSSSIPVAFEEGYRDVEKVIAYYKKALAEADRQYKSMVSQAEVLRFQVLKERYDLMPEDIKSTGLVSWDCELGWIAEVSY